MKVKITGKTEGYEAGLIYDLPNDVGNKIIADCKGILYSSNNDVDVTSLSDKYPAFGDVKKEGKKKVKHDR